MSIHIIIDGYNVIRQSNTLSALEDEDIQRGREALVEMLSAYRQTKRHRITVVFDGKNAPALSPRRDRMKGIELVFSRNGETADSVIKHLCEKEKRKALVVSSDHEIMDYAALQGSTAISSLDFEKKVEECIYGETLHVLSQDALKAPWDGSTKKKGPSKRHSKKERHRHIAFRKL